MRSLTPPRDRRVNHTNQCSRGRTLPHEVATPTNGAGTWPAPPGWETSVHMVVHLVVCAMSTTMVPVPDKQHDCGQATRREAWESTVWCPKYTKVHLWRVPTHPILRCAHAQARRREKAERRPRGHTGDRHPQRPSQPRRICGVKSVPDTTSYGEGERPTATMSNHAPGPMDAKTRRLTKQHAQAQKIRKGGEKNPRAQRECAKGCGRAADNELLARPPMGALAGGDAGEYRRRHCKPTDPGEDRFGSQATLMRSPEVRGRQARSQQNPAH